MPIKILDAHSLDIIESQINRFEKNNNVLNIGEIHQKFKYNRYKESLEEKGYYCKIEYNNEKSVESKKPKYKRINSLG